MILIFFWIEAFYIGITSWRSQLIERALLNRKRSCPETNDSWNETKKPSGKPNIQTLPNCTTTTSVEQTCNLKLSISTLQMNDDISAKLWWRKFVQYIKTTINSDLYRLETPMVSPRYRDQVPAKWRRRREKKPTTTPKYHLYLDRL